MYFTLLKTRFLDKNLIFIRVNVNILQLIRNENIFFPTFTKNVLYVQF